MPSISTSSLDRIVFHVLHRQAGGRNWADQALLAIARYGSYVELALMLLAGARRDARQRSTVPRCLCAVLSIYVLSELLGKLLARDRPFVSEPGSRALLRHSPERSFPSRHVASAMAMALVVRPIAPTFGATMAVAALGLALGRVRAGLHYPSDVLGGLLLGLLVGSRLGSYPRTQVQNPVRLADRSGHPFRQHRARQRPP